ncbi:MAG: hypothetical protein WAL79_03695 [Nitrososphaeraceae archaeon]
MEEMIGESIRPHVEMMSTAEKIKEAFSSLDSINLQKFDLVSKAMAAATDFVHQLIKTSEITASVSCRTLRQSKNELLSRLGQRYYRNLRRRCDIPFRRI